MGLYFSIFPTFNTIKMIILNVSGNVTGDATLKTLENGNTVTSFTVASNNRTKQKNGEYNDEVTYVRCAIWNNPQAAKLLYKGRSISAMGAFKLNSYNDSEGNKITALNLRVSFFQVFGKNKKNETVAESHTAPSAPLTPEEQTEIETDLPF